LPIRPPWSLPEPDFITACDRCGECAKSCGSRLITPGSGGFPEIDFARGECSFCADCVGACGTGALRRETDAQPWRLSAVLGEGCIALRGVVCGSCGDVCGSAAIRFTPAMGGVARPSFAAERCSGCGACFGVCPAGAIEMRSMPAPALA
jgi:ferredoxin-type protein NapF